MKKDFSCAPFNRALAPTNYNLVGIAFALLGMVVIFNYNEQLFWAMIAMSALIVFSWITAPGAEVLPDTKDLPVPALHRADKRTALGKKRKKK